MDSSFSGNTLTLVSVGESGSTATLQVYCGSKGEPIAIYTVNGTLTWSYNASTAILTLSVTHLSPARIVVYWRFPGDVDGDGDVDASDLFDLSKAYSSEPGDANWNPDCDFNGDDRVDAADLFDLSKNYGKTA